VREATSADLQWAGDRAGCRTVLGVIEKKYSGRGSDPGRLVRCYLTVSSRCRHEMS
jgi:hypothetical protein